MQPGPDEALDLGGNLLGVVGIGPEIAEADHHTSLSQRRMQPS